MATLRAQYDSQDDIPEAYRPLYTERDGKFELTEVEGVKTQGDFDRFESALRKRLTDATTKLESQGGNAGLSKDELREVFSDVVKTFIGDKGGQGNRGRGGQGDGSGGGSGGDGNGSSDPIMHDLERRLSAVEAENKSLKAERDQFKNEATTTKLDTQLQRAALAAGVDPKTLDMVVRLTKDDFELDNEGKAVVKLDPSIKGVTPNAAPAEYYKTISQDEIFTRFWPDSQGSGAGGSTSGSGGALGADNPFSKAGWNKTKQAQLVRNNPSEAERLAKAAGVGYGATRPNR